MMYNSGMLAKKRQQAIAQIVAQEGYANVKMLSEKLNITEKTIRLDLNELQKLGILKRIHGGAQSVDGLESFITPLRNQEKVQEKSVIASKAKELINENDIIFLDDGSTTYALARHLGDKRVTVITSDISIINLLAEKPNINLYVTGGRIRRGTDTYTATGPDCIRTISSYHINKCFLSTTSIDIKKGLMVFYDDSRNYKRALIDSSEETILLADSSKFGKTAFCSFAEISELQYIITDSGIEKDIETKIEKLVDNLIIAKMPE